MLVDEISKLCNEKIAETLKDRIKLRLPIFYKRTNSNKSISKENESGESPKSAGWPKVKNHLLKVTQIQNIQSPKMQQIIDRRRSKSWYQRENNEV